MSSRRFNAGWFTIALVAGAGFAHGQNVPDQAASAQAVKRTRLEPFLAQHCFDCHSGDAPKGGLNLRTFSVNVADAEVRRRWVHLYDRVANGEMPPESASSPDTDSKTTFLKTVAAALRRADLADREVVLRRLNRNEYENTVRDLFGIHVDVQRVLTDDSSQSGFDTIGSELSVSAEQLASYVEAADLVLDEVFGRRKEPRRMHKSIEFKEIRERTRADRETAEGGIMFGARPLPLWNMSVPGPGTYRVRIQAKAVQSDGPVVMRVSGGLTGSIASHVAGFFEVPPGDLTMIELTDRAFERSDNIQLAFDAGSPHWKLDADAYNGPGLLIKNIEVEGPLEEWPPPSRARLLGDVDPADGTLTDIREILLSTIRRAFRRAVDPSEVDPFVSLAEQALKEGKGFESSLRLGLKGVLCAPEFLYMEERHRRNSLDETGALTIDDHALASRLSYFLWSSLPDEELLVLADRGELNKPEILRAQVERLLSDPKSGRFVESFTGQWLRLRDIDFTVPDRKLFPEYNQLLRQSMLDETHAFFRELLDGNLSVQNFIESDFVMINQPLAEFYGIDDVKGLEIRRVELPAESVRGGLLTQASVLKVSADGTRTSPVLRGVWILKHLLGTPSPPPPPSVSAVEPDIRGATTIREQLAKHREHQSCNRCHRKIDPPGFALESFDVIGAQRDWYRRRGEGKYVDRQIHPHSKQNVQYKQGPGVDSSGKMADGRPFTGIRDYKRLLSENETLMARTLTRLLLTYGLGRECGFSDRPEVERIVAKVRNENNGLRRIIQEVVQSKTFQRP